METYRVNITPTGETRLTTRAKKLLLTSITFSFQAESIQEAVAYIKGTAPGAIFAEDLIYLGFHPTRYWATLTYFIGNTQQSPIDLGIIG